MVEPPDWFYRPFVFFEAQRGHEWTSKNLRERLDTGPRDYLVEAGRMVECDLGPEDASFSNDGQVPDDWEEDEQRRRAQLQSDYYNLLARTDSYAWGLGIAGLFHQWERDTKNAILELVPSKVYQDRLDRADFAVLCALVEATGFQISKCVAFDGLDTSRLITNAIKHGDGTSFRNLAIKRHDLIHGPVGVRIGNLAPRHQDLRLSRTEFDATVTDIENVWQAYAAALDCRTRQKQ